jgi:hypothetical protein
LLFVKILFLDFQRWGLIKKRQGQTSQGIAAKSTTSEERRLAHEAISHALGGFTSFLSGWFT